MMSWMMYGWASAKAEFSGIRITDRKNSRRYGRTYVHTNFSSA